MQIKKGRRKKIWVVWRNTIAAKTLNDSFENPKRLFRFFISSDAKWMQECEYSNDCCVHKSEC